MSLMRYQVRSEYGLADTNLYGAADRDDPEALLEGVAMAGLVGVLRQLGDLSEFAAEIFHCLHEELKSTAVRAHGLMIRVQQLEAELPSVEKVVLSQTDHSSYFSDPGLIWHSYVRAEETLIACGDLPHCIMDLYEECRGPPRLFLLDKFDVAGEGSCLKRYSDPSLFKTQTVSEIATSNIKIVRKSRKLKKNGSWGMDEETPEAAPTSNAKLHQLFLMEHDESGHRDPGFHVKPKRKKLNGSSINPRSGRSYMEKLLKSPPSDSETAPLSHSKLRFHTLRTDNASETETSYNLCQAIDSEVKVCNDQEFLTASSTVYSKSGNIKGFDMESQPLGDDQIETPCTEKGTSKDLDAESCVEVSFSPSTVDNYADIPASMEPKTTETESVSKPSDLEHSRVGEPHTCLDTPESQMEVPTLFSHVLHHSLEVEESKNLHTDFSSSSPDRKLPKIEGSTETSHVSSVHLSVNKDYVGMRTPEREDSPFNLSSEKFKADGFEMNMTETSAVSDVRRGSMLSSPPAAHPLSEFPQVPPQAEDTRIAVLLTNHCSTENVSYVESESVISFSDLMDDQFPSLTNQEIEVLKLESVSLEDDASLSAAESKSKSMPVILETKDAGAVNGCAHDEATAKEDENNTENRCSMNSKRSNLFSPTGISSEDCNLMPDAHLKTESEDISASISQDDPWVNHSFTERPSHSGQEDTQTVTTVADHNDHKETISMNQGDTLSCEASFSSDADHNQTGFSNIAMDETDLRTSILPESVCYQKDNLLVTQEGHSSEYCSWSRDQGQDSPLRHTLVDPTATSAEPLPSDVTAHDVSVYLHGLSSVGSAIGCSNDCVESEIESPQKTSHLQISEEALPLGLTELEAFQTTDRESLTSSLDCCSKPMLSMDQADEENCLDIFPKPVPPSSVCLYEETLSGPEDTPPLPPLPPTQWWIGKLVESIKTTEAPCLSVSSLAASESRNTLVHTNEILLDASDTNWGSDTPKMDQFLRNSRECTDPQPVISNEEKSEISHREPKGETEIPDAFKPSQTLLDKNSLTEKLSGYKGSCDNAIVAIDRSMLRKVSDRTRPPVGPPRVSEQESLLELIRSKTFNLRPAVVAHSKPHVQAVPISNLRIAAILEKANSLRQAMAGSDDDDNDSDSWSDS